MMERSEILTAMSDLKLFGMKAAFDEIITMAVKRQHEPQHIVGDLLSAEISETEGLPAIGPRAGPKARSIRYQISIAKLPLAKDVGEFQFDGTPINETLVHDLASGNFLAHQRNVELVGGTGTGKTHLAIALSRARVLYFGKEANQCRVLQALNSAFYFFALKFRFLMIKARCLPSLIQVIKLLFQDLPPFKICIQQSLLDRKLSLNLWRNCLTTLCLRQLLLNIVSSRANISRTTVRALHLALEVCYLSRNSLFQKKCSENLSLGIVIPECTWPILLEEDDMVQNQKNIYERR